eukprot:122348_1
MAKVHTLYHYQDTESEEVVIVEDRFHNRLVPITLMGQCTARDIKTALLKVMPVPLYSIKYNSNWTQAIPITALHTLISVHASKCNRKALSKAISLYKSIQNGHYKQIEAPYTMNNCRRVISIDTQTAPYPQTAPNIWDEKEYVSALPSDVAKLSNNMFAHIVTEQPSLRPPPPLVPHMQPTTTTIPP